MAILTPPWKKLATRQDRKEYRHRMKQAPTPAERIFADRLREAGILFEQQKGLGFYIADFFLSDRLVVIELDGGYHDREEQKRKDEFRDDFIRSCRLPVIRIKNEDAETWPLSKLDRYTIKSRSAYLSAMGRIGSRKARVCREKGWSVSKSERRATRKMFELPQDSPVTFEQVQAYRRQSSCRQLTSR
jgi:very-short-patch-repair endonuclease